MVWDAHIPVRMWSDDINADMDPRVVILEQVTDSAGLFPEVCLILIRNVVHHRLNAACSSSSCTLGPG